MQNNKYYEKIAQNVNYGILAKKIAGETLTEEEQKMCEQAKELGDAARTVRG